MVEEGVILVIGGSGVVGRRLARMLAQAHEGRLVVAGRRLEAAAAVAQEIGHGTQARRIDIEDDTSVREGLHDASIVVCCVEQLGDLVLREAIRRGLGYADLSPKLAYGRDDVALGEQATRTGARVLMGIGVCPGVSSMMARAMCDELGGSPDAIETSLLYGMGDKFGPDSMGFIARSANMPFEVLDHGVRRRVLPLREGANVDFPPPLGRRKAYIHAFSDAVTYPRTLGAKTAIARLAIDPRWLGRLTVAVARLHLLGVLARRIGGSRWLHARLSAHDRFALVVNVRRGDERRRMSLTGRHQADATAAAAAEFVGRLARGEPAEPGLWMPEQIVDPDSFFARFASAGWVVERES
jgi:saccharopine dehydrogenase-like NADP-dependent oxidoreductase